MNTIAEIQRINSEELRRSAYYLDDDTSASWHSKYVAASAWVYVGNLDYALTEGDVICILSQFGEIEDINLVRDELTGKSKGFGFVKYEDARSCVLAVDNFCGTKILGKSIRCDHVEEYRLPKHLQEKEESYAVGHAYKDQQLLTNFNLQKGQDIFAPVAQQSDDDQVMEEQQQHYEMVPLEDVVAADNVHVISDDHDPRFSLVPANDSRVKQKKKEEKKAKKEKKEAKKRKKERKHKESRKKRHRRSRSRSLSSQSK